MKYNGVSIKENALYESQEFTINYNRENLKNSKKVFIHYGTNGWQNVNEIEMLNTPNGFEAKINIPNNTDKFNFTFRDENSNWDNNNNDNFEFDVLPFAEKQAEDDELKYFANDFLLKYTDEISFDETAKELKQKPENKGQDMVETNSKGLSLEDLEDISFEHTKDELDKSIEEKFAQLFGKLEQEETVSQPIVEDEYELVPVKFTSDIPYVSLFKQAKAEALLSFEEANQIYSNEPEPIVYTSNINLINIMRMEANRKWVLAQAAKNENEEFALVRAFNPVEQYDNSFVGVLKQYISSIVQSFKKLISIVAEDLNPASDATK